MKFLSGGQTTIGRAETSDVVIDDPGVSRSHAAIRGDASGYSISDLSSSNGTYVNGIRLGSEPQKLENRDIIQVGAVNDDIQLVFMKSQETIGA